MTQGRANLPRLPRSSVPRRLAGVGFLACLPFLLPAPMQAAPAVQVAPAARSPILDRPQQDAPVCSPTWLRALRERPAGRARFRPEPQLLAPLITDSSLGRARPSAEGTAAAVAASALRPLGPSGNDELLQSSEPNDPYFRLSRQLNLRRAHFPEAWEVTFSMPEVKVAIVADGVDMGHAELVNKVWRNPGEVPGNAIDDDRNGYVDDVVGWDFGEGDADPRIVRDPANPGRFGNSPPTGTVMAGVVAAETHNGFGIAGAAWHARYMPLKTYYPTRDGRVGSRIDLVTEAICYAVNQRADVVLLSAMLVPKPDDEAVFNDLMQTQEAIEEAWRQGVPVVAPGGDCGKAAGQAWCPDPERYGDNRPTFPASLNRVIGVASLNTTDQTPSRSSFGDWVDIAAPGVDVLTTWAAGRSGYGPDSIINISGSWPTPSELAAAHVAAAIALLRTANPRLEPLRMQKALCDHANRRLPGQTFQPPPDGSALRNDAVGCGMLDVERALENIAWRPMLQPERALHPVDMDDPGRSPPLVLSSRNLNVSALALRSSQDWLRFERLNQMTGQAAQFALKVDGELLRREQGGGLAAGSELRPTVEAVVDAELYPNAHAQSGAQSLDLVFRVSRLSRVHLPTLLRGAAMHEAP